MNDKERYKIIIKNILEIKNKQYEIEKLNDEISRNILKKEYDKPDCCFITTHQLQPAIEEVLKETCAHFDDSEEYLIYKNIKIWCELTCVREEYKYIRCWNYLINTYKNHESDEDESDEDENEDYS